MNNLVDHALAYAEAGWPVFPLRPNSKRPATPNHTAAMCDQSDHRCRNGHTGWEQRATRNPDRIQTAWRMRPYGIGIACGPAGLMVIDLDTAKPGTPSGAQTLAQLEHDHGQTLPATWTTATPSGGRHLYYHQPPGTRLGNTAGKAGPGIDTRAWGGYIAAPPTTLPDGTYELIDDHPPTPLPTWFTNLITTQPKPTTNPTDHHPWPAGTGNRVDRYITAAITSELTRITTAPEGQRNHRLFIASIALGQLVGAHAITTDHAQRLLTDAAKTHITAGAYTTHQAHQTITSGLRRGTTEPRHLPTHLTNRTAS